MGERDWAGLLPEIVSKVADDLLAVDATEYIRLRAVCKPWRGATTDPSGPRPRFFPRDWLLLRKERDDDGGRPHRLVNVRSGAELRVRLPPAEEYGDLGDAEGLLVLRRGGGAGEEVCLFNPLTAAMVVAGLPPLPPNTPSRLASVGIVVADDGETPPTVVIARALWPTRCLESELLCAKPGDASWSPVDASCLGENDAGGGALLELQSGLSMRGRFYLATSAGDVLTVELRQRPRLSYVARQEKDDPYRSVFSGYDTLAYLVPSLHDGGGDAGMLLLRCFDSGFKIWEHAHVAVYGVHLHAGAGGTLHEDVHGRYLENRTVYLPSRTLVTDKFAGHYIAEGKVWPENCWRVEDAIQ